MSYKLLTPGQKAVNRDRTIMHFAWLTGIYHQYCHVSVHTKQNGRYTWQYPQEREQFLSLIVPEVEKFCGKWYTEGTNPDTIPHPVRIAIEWHNGRTVRDAVLSINPQYGKLLSMVHDRCERMGIELNVPSTEWEVAE